MNIAKSLVAGKLLSGAKLLPNYSPIDNTLVSKVSLLSESKLRDIFIQAKKTEQHDTKTDFSELVKLARFLKVHNQEFINLIIKESGFTAKDAADLVYGTIEFCQNYSRHLKEILRSDPITSFSFNQKSLPKIKLTSLPFGLIAGTTPRNTPLITELTIIVHALWSGNSLVLRPSPGVSSTVTLLIEGLQQCFLPETLDKLYITFSAAHDFINTSLDYANLLHYVGSTKYLEGTLVAGIKRGVKVLVDGDGCSLVLVDSDSDLKKAAEACYQGLVRCNGQICISIRVIVVEKKCYEQFLTYFLNHIKETVVAPPGMDSVSQVGPLFSSQQVDNIRELSKKYKLLYGQSRSKYGPNYVSPTVVELKPDDRTFLRESLFGPMVGVSYFENKGWKRWLMENPINLTDVLFSRNEKFIADFLLVSKSPRKVVNADPTIESVFEPWGAFLPSGANDVSYWYHKYRNYFQLVRKPY